MLILHTSDWHLGRSLHRADLTRAFELWSEHVIDLVSRRRIDAVLISGDVYDRGVPPASAVQLFDRTLAKLAELTTVIVTAGNHDSPLRLGFGSALMRPNIHIRTDSRLSGMPVEVRGDGGELGALVYPIPYLDPDVERSRLAPVAPGGQASGGDQADQAEGGEVDLLPRSHEAVLKAALDLVGEDIRHGEHAGAEVARIVMAHAFVTGGEASPSERDISVGGVDSVPSSLFRLGEEGPGPLAYVALGHLHSPQRVGRQGDPVMRYSGSPVAFSFSETSAKSSVLLHVEAGKVEVELIEAPVWRKVRTLEGTLAHLESLAGIGVAHDATGGTVASVADGDVDQAGPGRATSTPSGDLPGESTVAAGKPVGAAAEPASAIDDDAFVRVILTDAHRPLDMSARVRRAFPNVLEIQHRATAEGVSRPQEEIAAMKPKDVLSLFMESAGNRKLERAESALLDEVWERVTAARTAKARS
ncbi:MAG: exonuclease SbcCD subunit D C-terminal domain-containing protein [Actinomycetaceae bacterium]|nr:exonuclease SbcCD subunit D C-terminal domain-containing protein [Actinomycetaceae bacterium]